MSATYPPIKWRDVDPRTPGSAADLSVQKRRLEKQLRANGWSRSAAVTEVARRYAARNYA
jgi:hypothetical protein